ncbi:MAG: 4Fe-4S ferredoxin [Desulfobulbaceae bacterium]|jgi:NAD-dependent dihydropyrimidine dehydrogenase PreA subunit|nr:4Fe-4S ferredoxin [Desulfobulbaceae bacterium]
MTKIMRKIIEIDEELCNGCGNCITDCAESALEIIDGKAKLVAEKYCDGLGACMGDCPTGALKLIERECDDFDEEAVEQLLATNRNKETFKSLQQQPMECGCGGSHIQTFAPEPQSPATPCQSANMPTAMASGGASALTHWPVQIRLVPPSAPFLQGADLLIAADCAPLAYPSFHADFLKDKVVMMGCPKFDDQQSYVDKFAEIFATADIKSVTTVIMEVPCCGSMRNIIAQAMKKAGKTIPLTEKIITTRGTLVDS